MPKICYLPKTFKAAHQVQIDHANTIIAEYLAQGYDLTLRQLYYQMVARDLIPNNVNSYKNLGSVINDARLAGKIDWDRIQDLTRELRSLSHWEDPAGIIDSAAQSYRIDLWADQPYYVEVWVEKDALRNVVERVCTANDVPYFACRGYTSQSELWGAAMRLNRKRDRDGKDTLIFHLGDHDPSGIDMTRDIQDRLEMFGCEARVDRLALNMGQVEEYGPPPNPAKVTDSRFANYQSTYGDESWELDALTPDVIVGLIQDAIDTVKDEKLFRAAKREMEEGRRQLQEASNRWSEVQDFLEGGE